VTTSFGKKSTGHDKRITIARGQTIGLLPGLGRMLPPPLN